MAKTYEHIPPESVIQDQQWATDVNDVLQNSLNWNGIIMSPEANNIVFDTTKEAGIKVDLTTPVYPWVDMLGEISVDREAASNKPTFNIYKGNLKQYQFAVDDQVYINFHIPHDHVANTDIHIHAHWSANTSTSGTPTWEFEASYAKGHDQSAFGTNVTVSAGSAFTTTYHHMIDEVQLSAIGGAGSLLVTEDIEPDGIIIVRAKLASNTMGVSPFLHYVDLHYQSTGIGTKNKAPNFYS